MKKFKYRQQGFTLLELMVTAALVAILAAIALPSYQDTVRKSRRADAYDALLECASAQARRYSTSAPQSYFDQAGASSANVCGADGTDLFSKEGYYQLSISNPNCTQNSRFWCFSVTATVVGPQADDTDCQSFTIDHTGLKTAAPNTEGRCWRS